MEVCYSNRQSNRAVESDSVSSHDRGGGRGGEGDDDWLWVLNLFKSMHLSPIPYL